MREKIKVSIQQKTVTGKGLAPEDAAAFRSFVPDGSLELTVVTPAANHLPDKQRKELAAVCAFARMKEFPCLISRFAGIELAESFTEVDPESWTGRIVNPNSAERSQCRRSDVSTVPI